MTHRYLVWIAFAIVISLTVFAVLAQPPAKPLGRISASKSPAMFSPDGRYFLAGSATEPHEYCLWDVTTQKLVRSFSAPKKAGKLFGTFVTFSAAAFSADGKLLATGSDELRLWDVKTGKQLRSWPGPLDGLRAVHLSPDGQLLLSIPAGDRDRAVRLWDTQTGKQLHEFPGSGGWTVCCLSPKGDQVAVVNGDNHEVTVWNTGSGAQVIRFPLIHDTQPIMAVYHTDGNSLFIASLSDNGGIRRYEIATGKHSGIVVKQADLRGVGFTQDTSVVATMTYADQIVRFWDLSTGKVKGMVTAANSQLWAIALAPNGKLLAVQPYALESGFVLSKAPE